MRLTPEQQALVLASLRLPTWFASRFAASICGDEREDLLACLRLALVDAAGRHDPNRGAFSTFAVWAMRTALLRWWRYRRRQEGDLTGQDLDPVPAPERDEDARLDALEVAGRVRALLPPDRWRLLWGHHALGLPLEELARQEGLPVGIVHGRVSKARLRVRREMAVQGQL